MATLKLNSMTNAVLTANAAAKQGRIAFGVVANLAMPPAILSQGRHPSPSSRLEPEPGLRPCHDATRAYMDTTAKRAGRPASFSGSLACLLRLSGQLVTGKPIWRRGTVTPTTFGPRVRGFGADSGRVGSDPFGWCRQSGGRDYLSHDRRGHQRDTDSGRFATLVVGAARTALRGK